MRFTLYFDGPIRGNGAKSADKDRIRNAISPQLSQLWRDNKALCGLLESPYYKPVERRGRYFRAMAVEALSLRCDLDILLLVPESGFSVYSRGDLDNRIKTLVDGLRLPTNEQEVSDEVDANSSTSPLDVLLEDDRLISKITAQSDILLGASVEKASTGYSRALIKVNLYPAAPNMDTFSLL